MRAHRWLPVVMVPILAGCTTRHSAVVVAEPPPVVATNPAPSLPPGATPGMLVPQPLADGSFPTPNRGLFGDAAIWHLRAGLNVAALSCPGEEGATIRAGYNSWLSREKAPLARVATAYAAEYRGAPAGAGFDEAMTRLYNFYSQTPVRPAFCTAAAAIIAAMTGVDAAALPGFAAGRLAALDQPFVDFYRAYDAWRRGRQTVVIASAAPAPVAAAMAAPRPALTLDLSSLPADTEVTAAR